MHARVQARVDLRVCRGVLMLYVFICLFGRFVLYVRACARITHNGSE